MTLWISLLALAAPPCGETPVELVAATPREDENLEALALTLGEAAVAAQEDYDRVVRDVAILRRGWPDLAHIGYRERNDGRMVLMGFEPNALREIREDRYRAWDCLNAHYGLVEIDRTHGWVTLKGLYDTRVVAREYARLSGVRYAERNGSWGDGPTICARREGDAVHYVFRNASGGWETCMMGSCGINAYRGFIVQADGGVVYLGQWRRRGDAAGPAWLDVCDDAADPSR